MKRREYITPLITLVIAMALVLGGCTKTEEADMPLTQIEQITPKTLEEQILDMLSILDKKHVMEIVASEGQTGGEPTVVFYMMPKPDGFGASRAIVCKDTNQISFVKCVRNWLTANEGRCLKIYYEDGVWYADDDCKR